MKERSDREQLNDYLRVFRIESVFNEKLLPHLSLYDFDQGELICSQEDPAHHLYILVKGKLKIYTTTAEGRTLILSFKTPLDVIGDIEYVRGTNIINTVEAVSPVRMIGVHYRWLHHFGQDDPSLLQFLLKIITNKFAAKSSSMNFNMMYPVEVRLASYLLSVFFDESDSLLNDPLNTGSLTDAANLIGTSYRHLNRVLRQFCSDGLIERSKGLIVIKNREGLSKLANHNIYEEIEG